MKMVKSLLLGSAAGLVAVAGAQAADLPVKAKPVEYVKVCSLYGAGYYYMPGTDICLKVGGYVRFQTSFGTNQHTRPALIGTNRRDDVNGAGYGWRTRAVMTLDSRQQTAYGTLRTYFLIGFQQDNGSAIGTTNAVGLYATRGFIQIAGFTFGKATSFFDHFPTAGRAYFAGNFHNSSTGDGGWNVAAYTAQFGNGVSATIALEEGRNARSVGVAAGVYGNVAQNARYGALRGYPDIVANLRVDQAWGSVMIGGALHDASAAYWNNAAPAGGSPGNQMGWALTAATELNVPFLAPGSKFNAQFIYARGASQYASHTSAGGGFDSGNGTNNTRAFGNLTDGIYVAGSGIELTTAWSLALAYQHQWTPNLNTSFYGSYLEVTHSQNAKAWILAASGLGAGAVVDPDWSTWNLGARTEWQPIRGLTLGVDVVYNKIKSATFRNAAGDTGVANPFTGANYRTGDRDSFAGMFRVQRNFLP